jgi:hypothetical protein
MGQRLRIPLAVPRTSILWDVRDLDNCWGTRPAVRSNDQMSMVVARGSSGAAAITFASCEYLHPICELPAGVAASTLKKAWPGLVVGTGYHDGKSPPNSGR